MAESKRSIWEIFAVILRASLLKTLYMTLRSRRPIIVGRRVKILLGRSAKIIISKNGILTIGIRYDGKGGGTLKVKNNAVMHIKGIVHIMRGVEIEIGEGAELTIGGSSFINENTTIVCHRSVSIGDGCAIGWRNNILDSDLHFLMKDSKLQPKTIPVKIGNHVWTGFDVGILKGVEIGDGSVVAAKSLVTKSIPSKSLAMGSPARVTSSNVKWADEIRDFDKEDNN